MKNFAQKFGKFLSGMVMPNIGAFIAWGFITALFIPDGWLPNEGLASIQPHILTYLLPILIAAQGGKMVGGDRGRVMGTIAIMGCIAGSDYTMLMGAMAIGPLAGWVIKKFDKAMEGNMPAGFEMLINNFSVGIFGMIMAILGYYIIGPVMGFILSILAGGVQFLVNASLLPLVAIFLEPAKVLFLNNAINHGVFTPIGITQAAETGKSIMYMLEANPGPGLGVLIAYWMFSKDKMTKDSAPGTLEFLCIGDHMEFNIRIHRAVVGCAHQIRQDFSKAGNLCICTEVFKSPVPGMVFFDAGIRQKHGYNLYGIICAVLFAS